MLEVSLNEAAYTIATGILFLTGIAAIAYLFHRDRFDQLRETLSTWSPRPWWVDMVAVVVLSFLLGLAAENTSDTLTDGLLVCPFGESCTRTDALFERDGILTSLGRELYDQDDLQQHGLIVTNDLGAVANSLYYRAKNTVYRQENYFAELSLVQTRIDFSRSLAFVSMLFVMVGILETVFYPSTGSTANGAQRLPQMKRVGGFCAVYVAIGGVGLSCFVSEEREFNSRVFGYYSTMQEPDAPRPRQHPEEWPIPLSGIVKWGDHYLAASDEKGNTLPRLYNLEIAQERVGRLYPAVVDWGEELNRYKPTDIESLCAPDSAGQRGDVWVLESGHYQDPLAGAGRPGRLVRLLPSRRRGVQFVYAGHYQLPNDVNNIEGMHCWRGEDGRPFFLVAERGGAVQSKLRVWRIAGQQQPQIVEQVKHDVPRLSALVEMSTTGGARWISGLTAQPDPATSQTQTLWATGAIEEETAEGKTVLASVIYRVGVIGMDGVELEDEPALCNEMPGNKFEGITMSGNPGEFVIVADNETRGLAAIVAGCPATWGSTL